MANKLDLFFQGLLEYARADEWSFRPCALGAQLGAAVGRAFSEFALLSLRTALHLRPTVTIYTIYNMKLLEILTYFSIVSGISAATFKAPVHVAKKALDTRTKKSQGRPETIRSSRTTPKNTRGLRCQDKQNCGPLSLYGSSQHYLNDLQHGKSVEAGEDTTPVWAIDEISYITILTIGTPPQPFNALISVSGSDLIVPSSTCDYRCGNYSSYNKALSSSHIHHKRRFIASYLRCSGSSLLSEDILQLGGINITHQKFGAADDMARWPLIPFWGWDDPSWDGILGLAPSNGRSELGLLNPLQNMKEQKLLDRNVFSLKLPRGEEGGEILFGDVNQDLFVGELKSLPVINDPNEYPRLQGSWAVPATSISIGNGSASLSGHVATIESDLPAIGLPEVYTTLLWKYMGMESNRMESPSVDCARRPEMENLTITLGEHDFVITPWEYTIEMESEYWEGKRCMTALMPMPDFATNYIALGAAFLKRFYTVFDLDKQTVSFGDLS